MNIKDINSNHNNEYQIKSEKTEIDDNKNF